jgi:hypothetical protein
MRAAVCAVGLVAMALALSTVGQPGITLIPAHQRDTIQGHHRLDGRNSTSTNWSGYAVTGSNGSVTHVTGSWIVPAASCNSTSNGYSSFWVGIDGYTSNTVEQIGTDSDCVSLLGTQNTPTYYAWFEFYPKGAYLIGSYDKRTGRCQSNCVSVGDEIIADVSYGGGGPKGRSGSSFTVTITDKLNGVTKWSYATSSSVSNAQAASAEWIAEAPSSGGVLPLADFGLVTFTSGQATIGASELKPIGQFTNFDAITMLNRNGVPIATPSGLDSNGGFTVLYHPAP